MNISVNINVSIEHELDSACCGWLVRTMYAATRQRNARRREQSAFRVFMREDLGLFRPHGWKVYSGHIYKL